MSKLLSLVILACHLLGQHSQSNRIYRQSRLTTKDIHFNFQCPRFHSRSKDQLIEYFLGKVSKDRMESSDNHQSTVEEQPYVASRFTSGQHIRSPLARAVYNKMREDEANKNNRHVYVSIICRFILMLKTMI